MIDEKNKEISKLRDIIGLMEVEIAKLKRLNDRKLSHYEKMIFLLDHFGEDDFCINIRCSKTKLNTFLGTKEIFGAAKSNITKLYREVRDCDDLKIACNDFEIEGFNAGQRKMGRRINNGGPLQVSEDYF